MARSVSAPSLLLLLVVVAVGAFIVGPTLAAAQAKPDPCKVLADKLMTYSDAYPQEFLYYYYDVFARPSEVLPCTGAVPYNAIRDNGTLNSIILFFKNHYSLVHAAKNSPDARLPSNYDVIGALRGVQKGTWTSMDDFYDAVFRAVDGLDDGHTAFLPNCPYFTFHFPLPLSYVVSNGAPRVIIPPLTLFDAEITTAAQQAPFQFNATKYSGYTVNLIDGQPAWDYLLKWSNSKAGVFHDPSQKLNWALATAQLYNGTYYPSYGAFGQRFRNPKADYINLTLSSPGGSPQNVLVPWLSRTYYWFIYDVTSTKDYYLYYCDNFQPRGISQSAAAQTNNSRKFPAPKRHAAKVFSLKKHHKAPPKELPKNLQEASFASRVPAGLEREPTLAVAASSARADATQISGDWDFFMVYKLSDEKTCVISLFTFSYDFYYLFLELQTAFQTANSSCSQILIDLSNNGGGYVILASWTLELILGSNNYPKPLWRKEDPYQLLADTDFVLGMRGNDLGPYDWENGDWGPYADTLGEYFTESTKGNFFYPTRKLQFGKNGATGTYSNLYTLGNPTAAEFMGETFPPAFGSKPVAFFSNGFCFSACNTFTYAAKTVAKVPLVTIGGIPGKNMAFAAAGGGYVSSDIASILYYMNFYVSQLTDTPGGFGVRASLPMRFANGIPRLPGSNWNSFNFSAPIEFTFLGSDFSIPYTIDNVADIIAQYEDAAKAVFK